MDNKELERYMLLEIDGPAVSPETIDAPTALELAAAFFSLVKANSTAAGLEVELRGLQIFDKCVAFGVPFHSSALMREVIDTTYRQIVGTEEPTHGAATFVTRAKTAIGRLPKFQTARIFLGTTWQRQIALELPAVQPLDSLLSVRARPIRVGGERPSVRFESSLEAEPFTLNTSKEDAKKLGALLYQDVDIEARVVRDEDGNIERGRLLRFDPVSTGDPHVAWKEWYRSVASERDAIDDIESELKQ